MIPPCSSVFPSVAAATKDVIAQNAAMIRGGRASAEATQIRPIPSAGQATAVRVKICGGAQTVVLVTGAWQVNAG